MRTAVPYRHEHKHLLDAAQTTAVLQRLRAVVPHDRHAGPDGCYHVRSLYFDTPADRALREKLDGVDAREKYRLRYYNRDPSRIQLERKCKKGGLCVKQSAPVTAEQCSRLLLGDIRWLRETGDPLLTGFYAALLATRLRPRTIVDYVREAFCYPTGNVRITLDRDIRSGLSATHFLSDQVPTVSATDLNVLEVKYDAYLPAFLRDLIQLENARTEAFSKYAQCRTFF